MACSKHSRCTECTFDCGYWFLTMENMTTICLEDPGTLGVGAIGMQNNYRMCYLVDPTTSGTTTTTTTLASTSNPAFSSSTAQPVIAVAAFVPILIGCIGAIGFLLACGGMVFCWWKKRKSGYQLTEMRELIAWSSIKNPRGVKNVHFRQNNENAPPVDIELGNIIPAAQTPIIPASARPASDVTSYDLPPLSDREGNEQSPIRAVSHITTVWDADGRAHSAETRF